MVGGTHLRANKAVTGIQTILEAPNTLQNNLLIEGMLQSWFRILIAEHCFDGPKTDLIEIAFINLPIIRAQIEHFVHLRNIHKIQNQPNCPYLIPGKPLLNFFHPELKNPEAHLCGQECNLETLARLQEAIMGYVTVSMQGSLERVLHCLTSSIVGCKLIFADPEHTLTLETNEWCSRVLHEANFATPIAVDMVVRNGNDMHKIAYL
jgi:hypothetical protein